MPVTAHYVNFEAVNHPASVVWTSPDTSSRVRSTNARDTPTFLGEPMNRSRISIIALAAAAVATVGLAVPVQAATPVPGRFCASADAGKVVKTAKYGKVKCARSGDRYRWKDIAG